MHKHLGLSASDFDDSDVLAAFHACQTDVSLWSDDELRKQVPLSCAAAGAGETAVFERSPFEVAEDVEAFHARGLNPVAPLAREVSSNLLSRIVDGMRVAFTANASSESSPPPSAELFFAHDSTL